MCISLLGMLIGSRVPKKYLFPDSSLPEIIPEVTAKRHQINGLSYVL